VLKDGTTLAAERRDYEGFLTRPMSWQRAREKFERLADATVEPEPAAELADAVAALDELDTRELTGVLASMPPLSEKETAVEKESPWRRR
jgi:2-methylcitrate dehydratase